MGRSKILIPPEELKRLYIDERLSPARIGALYGCDGITVRSRIKEAGIPFKSKSIAQTRYEKFDFRGSSIEKAYMLGFKYGDLNAYQPPGASQTIVVRSHSTLSVQGDLFKELFEQYGTITVSKGTKSTQMNCYLNMSFSFLLGKYPPQIREWLHTDDDLMWSFSAGYIDAEGTFGLNQGKGRFKIDAYDQLILSDIHSFLLRSGIRSKSRVIARKGENDYGWEWKQDLWRVEVNEAASIEKLVTALTPYLRHKKRVNDANMVLQNIQARRLNGTVK